MTIAANFAGMYQETGIRMLPAELLVIMEKFKITQKDKTGDLYYWL